MLSVPYIPRMGRVRGHPVSATATKATAFFNALLVGVVAGLAERLPVGGIPEQGCVATVRANVVNYGLGTVQRVAAHRTKWV